MQKAFAAFEAVLFFFFFLTDSCIPISIRIPCVYHSGPACAAHKNFTQGCERCTNWGSGYIEILIFDVVFTEQSPFAPGALQISGRKLKSKESRNFQSYFIES